MKKIPKKYYNIVFCFLMAILMSCIMSFFVTFRNIGFSDEFMMRWLTAWWGAFLVGFSLNLFIVPLVRKGMGKIIES